MRTIGSDLIQSRLSHSSAGSRQTRGRSEPECECEEPTTSKEFASAHLHLCKTTVHEQFGSRDIATVVGCEKHDGLRDLVRSTEAAERNAAGNQLHPLLACLRRSQKLIQSWRVDRAW